MGDLLITSGEQRLAAVLVRLADAWEGQPPAPIPLSQQLIGQMSNLSRDRVNRFLQHLVKVGCIELRYGSVVITDLAALEVIALRGAKPSLGRSPEKRSTQEL